MKKLLLGLGLLILNVESLSAQQSHVQPTQLLQEIQAISATSQPQMESEVFHLINQHRAANSLPPLRWASTPAHLARKHSLDMAKGLVPFGHQGAAERFAEIRQKNPSVTRFGENVAYNYGYSKPAEVAVNGWLASPGHYANIMGDYNFSGVGVALNANGEYYFTQIFVKASSTSFGEDQNEELFITEAQVSDFAVQY